MSQSARIIVITGVTRGLGRALALRFEEMGHTVLGCGRNHEQIGELVRAFGHPHDFAAVDVASDAEVRAWAERLLKAQRRRTYCSTMPPSSTAMPPCGTCRRRTSTRSSMSTSRASPT